MRIGLNFTPPHESPEQWAEILEDCGFRAASFPVDYRAPVGLIDAYTKAAREHDIRNCRSRCVGFGPTYRTRSGQEKPKPGAWNSSGWRNTSTLIAA